jgi:hypothetical protein
MLGPQQWQLLHVEKDDQVKRHNNNNNKNWETKEKSIRKAFLFKTFVKKKLQLWIFDIHIIQNAGARDTRK